MSELPDVRIASLETSTSSSSTATLGRPRVGDRPRITTRVSCGENPLSKMIPGRLAGDVLKAVDALNHEVFLAERGDADRNFLQRFLALARHDHDFLKLLSVNRKRQACRANRQDRSAQMRDTECFHMIPPDTVANFA